MAIFNNMSITNKGQALYAKAQTGIELHFTKAQIGSGAIGTQNPALLLALITPKFDVGIQSITANTEAKTATVSTYINNDNVTEPTYICEIGLFAQDPDVGEILYAYGSAGTFGDFFAPATSGPYSWSYQINASVGNAANVTIELSSLMYDYGLTNTNTTFVVISGGNQKEINKSIDTCLSDMDYQTAGGTATAITLTMQTLRNGYAKTFIASASNSGAATKINTKPLYKPGTTTPPNLIKDKAYTVWYNLTGDCFFIKASAEGNVLASQVLKDKTFSNGDDTGLVGTLDLSLLITGNIRAGITINGITGATNVVDTTLSSNQAVAANIRAGYKCYVNGALITGTATEKAAATITPTTTDQTIASGVITTGVQTIKGDANLVADNIVSGKNIFGVAGSAIVDPLTTLSAGTDLYIVLASASTTYINISTYTKLKEIKMNRSGTIRVSFDIKNELSGYKGYGRVYINGVAVGIERITASSNANLTTYTEDFTITAGSLVQFYGKKDTDGGGYLYLSNFKFGVSLDLTRYATIN